MRKYLRIGIAVVLIAGVVAAIFALRGQLGQPAEKTAKDEAAPNDAGTGVDGNASPNDDPLVVDAGDLRNAGDTSFSATHPVDSSWAARGSPRSSGYGDVGAGPLRVQTPPELPDDEVTTASGTTTELPPLGDDDSSSISMPPVRSDDQDAFGTGSTEETAELDSSDAPGRSDLGGFDDGATDVGRDTLASQPTERDLTSVQATPVAPQREPRRTVTFREPPQQAERTDSATSSIASSRYKDQDRWVIQRGDTLWSIAKERYGSAEYFNALVKWNAKEFPNAEALRPGAVVRTPDPQELENAYPEYFARKLKSTASARSTATDSTVAEKPGVFRGASGEKFYRVGPSDNLFAIARKTLGKGARWKEILELNRQSLPDPNRLSPGMVLRLPASAVADESVYSARSEFRAVRR